MSQTTIHDWRQDQMITCDGATDTWSVVCYDCKADPEVRQYACVHGSREEVEEARTMRKRLLEGM